MTRVPLSDGQWAQLYEPRKVRERSRRRYVGAVADLNAEMSKLPQIPNPTPGPGQPATIPDPGSFGSRQTDMSDRLTDMLILCLVKEWPFGPVDDDTLAELDAETYDTLSKACRDLAPQLTPDLTSPDPDPKAAGNGSTPPPPGSSTAAATSATLSSATTS